MVSSQRDIMDTKGVAEFIHRSPGAIRNLVMRRAIPFRKTGGRLIFFREEIVMWIDTSPGVKLNELEKEPYPTSFIFKRLNDLIKLIEIMLVYFPEIGYFLDQENNGK